MRPRSDANAAEAARQVQAHAKTWLVMWSPWHQRFDAWEYSDQERCRTVQAPTAGELWDRIQDAELEILWLTVPPYGLPLTPAASREGQPLPVAPERIIPGPNGPPQAERDDIPGPHPTGKEGAHHDVARLRDARQR